MPTPQPSIQSGLVGREGEGRLVYRLKKEDWRIGTSRPMTKLPQALGNQFWKVSVVAEVSSSTAVPNSSLRPTRVSTPHMAHTASAGSTRSVSPSEGSGLMERREAGVEAGVEAEVRRAPPTPRISHRQPSYQCFYLPLILSPFLGLREGAKKSPGHVPKYCP